MKCDSIILVTVAQRKTELLGWLKLCKQSELDIIVSQAKSIYIYKNVKRKILNFKSSTRASCKLVMH